MEGTASGLQGIEKHLPEPMPAYRIAVLASGHSRGSNLKAMHDFFIQNHLSVTIEIAFFTRGDSPAVQLARSLGITTCVIPAKNMEYFEDQVACACKEHDISLIALAGFLKQLSGQFLSRMGIPVLNIHPALLPKYGGPGMYGKAVHEAVFNAGEKLSGATVHLVDPQYDHGHIIAQEMVEISQCQSPDEIAATVLETEHKLYGQAIYKYLSELSH